MCFLLIGPAKSIRVAEFDSGEEISVINGKSLQFDVEILDKGGNVTAQPKLNAVCKVVMQPYNTQSRLMLFTKCAQRPCSGLYF